MAAAVAHHVMDCRRGEQGPAEAAAGPRDAPNGLMEEEDLETMGQPGSPEAYEAPGARLAPGQLEAAAAGMEGLALGGAGPSGWRGEAAAAGPGPGGAEAELAAMAARLERLAGTLGHWREWGARVALRYASYSPEVSRPAKRIYVGGLPAVTVEAELRAFITRKMADTGATVGGGSPVTGVKLYAEKNYGFLEFRSIEEASNCMALDGLKFQGSHLRIRRPNNYLPEVAMVLGPDSPDPTIDLSAEPDRVRTVVVDSPHKLFIGGLPCDWGEEQVRSLLEPYGRLGAFNLVMDKSTGNSKGYAFAEMADLAATDVVVAGLNGRAVGNKQLTVKRALAPKPQAQQPPAQQPPLPQPH